MSLLWVAIVLGIVEGLTEFLPVSSTGHLILAERALRFTGARADLFAVFIQLGAILAVVWEYRGRLLAAVTGLSSRPEARRFAGAVAIAFFPAAALGFLIHEWIESALFSPRTVAFALLAGAVAILVVEALPLRPRTEDAEAISRGQALAVGLAQCVALWPGFSRSAATILGGLSAGLSRRAATEFSFFLAVPVMTAASLFSLRKHRHDLHPGDGLALALAFILSFLVAWASIRWLLRYVATHRFRPFAWYRIALALLVLWVF
ncbi:MAG TPA: undecaprenyl-diphosphate phosphatase [Candidatus Polarisedimenticolaceae bacterium]|nr:undecaprenyl-diphosphate phosphatase [Candidatus Polarisedimenticolaceae bacterium]